jgi:predicted amino acid dehydrogenase
VSSLAADVDFAFLVHPLVRWHRRALGVRLGHLPLALGGPANVDGVGLVATVELETARGDARGVIVAVPDVAEDLAASQGRALVLERRAAQIAVGHGARAIGLGNALSVVAARGSALAGELEVPVTTGHASTAWATVEITRAVLEARGSNQGPVGVLGYRGTVGGAVAACLAEGGARVIVDASGRAARLAAKAGCEVVSGPEQVAAAARVLVGASTTGPTLQPSAVQPNTTLVDLALPPTLFPGARPEGLQVLAGERIRVPGALRRGAWGALWLGFAQYGRGCVFACFAEPLALALGGEVPPSGRRVGPAEVAAAGAALTALGFRAAVDQAR